MQEHFSYGSPFGSEPSRNALDPETALASDCDQYFKVSRYFSLSIFLGLYIISNKIIIFNTHSLLIFLILYFSGFHSNSLLIFHHFLLNKAGIMETSGDKYGKRDKSQFISDFLDQTKDFIPLAVLYM